MPRKQELIPKVMLLPLAFTLICNTLTYNGSRLLTAGRFHYDLSCSLDARIPFVPWTVSVYLGCYLFWVINYVIACRQERTEAFRFLGADLLAKLVCLFCFLIFPTTNTRPVIEGNSIWEELMRLLYRMDAADNLFPSIHCLTSWFCVVATRGNARVPGWYKTFSVLFALSVCVSTLTTKQHVVIDAVAGVALAEIAYWFAGRSGFARWYERALSGRAKGFGRNKGRSK